MEKRIPKEVKAIADQECCNQIEYIGQLDGKDVFGICQVDDTGLPLPTGLPNIVLWDGKKGEVVTGKQSMSLLSRLDKSA